MHRLRRARLCVVGVILLALAACSGAAPVDSGKVADEVKGAAHQLAAYNAHDAAKAVSFDALDYVGMFHGGPVVSGPAADLAAMEQQVADSAVRFDLADEKVDVAGSGEFAVYRARYAYRFTDPKTKAVMVERGNWAAAFRRQGDGSMKLVWTMGADAGPVVPGNQ